MEDFFDQIMQAAVSGAYYLALAGALMIPDMCAALESEDGTTSGTRYKAWFDANVARQFSNVDGEDCYRFRCALIHQGSSQHPGGRCQRVVFIEPPAPHLLHDNVLGDALNLDVALFCQDLVEPARAWLARVEKTDVFRRNHDRLVRRHPDGLAPYIVGVPVISGLTIAFPSWDGRPVHPCGVADVAFRSTSRWALRSPIAPRAPPAVRRSGRSQWPSRLKSPSASRSVLGVGDQPDGSWTSSPVRTSG